MGEIVGGRVAVEVGSCVAVGSEVAIETVDSVPVCATGAQEASRRSINKKRFIFNSKT